MRTVVLDRLFSNGVEDVGDDAADRHSEHVVEEHALEGVFVN